MAVQQAAIHLATILVNQLVETRVKVVAEKLANIHAQELAKIPAEEDASTVLANNQCNEKTGIALGYNMGDSPIHHNLGQFLS